MVYVVKHIIDRKKISFSPLGRFDKKEDAQEYIKQLSVKSHHGATLVKKTKNTLTLCKQINTYGEKHIILIRISNNLLANPKIVMKLQTEL